jgi:hypothetical protein
VKVLDHPGGAKHFARAKTDIDVFETIGTLPSLDINRRHADSLNREYNRADHP